MNLDLFYEILHNQKKYYNNYVEIKSNGKRRYITSPNEEYKSLQRFIVQFYKNNNYASESDISFAWSNGKNREQCAARHVGQNYLFLADIKNFFPSIKTEHVYNILENFPTPENVEVADLIQFITIPKGNKRILPQGFVTSPIIANWVRYSIDIKLKNICNENNWTVSVYGDNVFVSGETNPYVCKNIFVDIFDQNGFKLHKIHYKPFWKRQSVLGITVNSQLTVSQDYKQQLLNEVLYYLNNNLPIDNKILGKINVFRSSDNHRDFNYFKKLITKGDPNGSND